MHSSRLKDLLVRLFSRLRLVSSATVDAVATTRHCRLFRELQVTSQAARRAPVVNAGENKRAQLK